MRTISLIKDYKKECILSPFFKLLEALMELLVPLLVSDIIDKGIALSDKPYIIKTAGLMVLFSVFGLLFAVTAQYYAAKGAAGFAASIRSRLFSHIQKLSYSQLDSIGTSTLITRLTSDVNQVQTGTNLTLRLLLRSPLIVFGAMIMAFTISKKAAIIFLITIAVLFIIVFSIMLLTIPLYKKTQDKLDGITESTIDSLKGVRVIRAFCKEPDEVEDFNKKNKSLVGFMTKTAAISSALNPLTYLVINLAVIAVISQGAALVNTGELSTGSVVALYNYLAQILVELIKLANLIINITKSLAGAKRITYVLNISPEEETDKGINDGSIDTLEFRSVSFSYKNAGAPSVDQVNFSAKRGEFIGIIGSTGAGKTSLINLIPGFYPATSGEILINGKNISTYSNEFLRSRVSVVPQKSVLISGTVRENIAFGNAKITDSEIMNILEYSCCTDFVPDIAALDNKVEQNGKNFSGGQRQRLCIARALAGSPDIIIFDDSFSALDNKTTAALLNNLKGISKNPIVFLISQRPGIVKNADKILFLDIGKQIGFSSHSKLLETCSGYRNICAVTGGGAE